MNLTGEMKFYLGKDYAQLKFSETNTSYSIDIITVPGKHRGIGIGSSLIQRIILLADSMQKDVFVSARPIGASNEKNIQRLVKFYQKFDFDIYDRGITAVYMKRMSQNLTVGDK